MLLKSGCSFSLSIHCKKKLSGFPFPSRNVTNQTLPANLFLQCISSIISDSWSERCLHTVNEVWTPAAAPPTRRGQCGRLAAACRRPLDAGLCARRASGPPRQTSAPPCGRVCYYSRVAEPLPLLAGNHKLHKEGGGVLEQQICRPNIFDQLGNGRESPLAPPLSSYKLACCECLAHRIYRVPGFRSSRPNWIPHPLTRKGVLLLLGETRSLAREGVWGTQFRRRDRHPGTLCILWSFYIYGLARGWDPGWPALELL